MLNKYYKQTILKILTPLDIGGFIYIAFRSKSLVMFNWFEAINLNYYIDVIRSLSSPIKEKLPQYIIFSLPDGLWVYSFTSALLLVWGNQVKTAKLWLLLPLILGCGAEIGQYFKIVKGTYDVIDFSFCLVAVILSIITINPKIIYNENKQKIHL